MSKFGALAIILAGLATGFIGGRWYGKSSFSGIDKAIACGILADAVEVGAIAPEGVDAAVARLSGSERFDHATKLVVRLSPGCVSRALSKRHDAGPNQETK